MKIALIILISILIILLISVFVLVILDTLKIDYLYYYLEDGKLTKTTKQDKKPDLVYFSDIHIGAYLKKEEASKLLKDIRNLDAKVYLFGGDLFGINTKKYYNDEDIREIFSVFDDKECIAVYGNHEYKKDNSLPSKKKIELFDKMGFKILKNESCTVKIDNKDFEIYGMDDFIYHEPCLPTKKYDLILAHEGDIAKDIDNQVILAGHTHGGQIRLPLIPIFYKPRKGRMYTHGLFHIANTDLLVTNGVGFGAIKIRFNARRELVVIYLKEEK